MLAIPVAWWWPDGPGGEPVAAAWVVLCDDGTWLEVKALG
jgi:hypothetical protein